MRVGHRAAGNVWSPYWPSEGQQEAAVPWDVCIAKLHCLPLGWDVGALLWTSASPCHPLATLYTGETEGTHGTVVLLKGTGRWGPGGQ